MHYINTTCYTCIFLMFINLQKFSNDNSPKVNLFGANHHLIVHKFNV